jgi:hypothetical protein
VTALSDAFGGLFELSLGSAIFSPWGLVFADILLRDALGAGIARADEVREYPLMSLTAPWILVEPRFIYRR